AQRKQIIITSDTYPKELAGIDSRLISRFDSGLTVAIEPPELEMRVAILLRKAESEGVPMPEEVAFFIAKHLQQCARTRGRVAQGAGLCPLPRARCAVGRRLQRGAERPAVGVQRADHGR